MENFDNIKEDFTKSQTNSPSNQKDGGESFWKKYGVWCICAIVLIVIVILIVVISKTTDCGRADAIGDQIQLLLRDTKRYYSLATQDKDPLIAYGHANYAFLTIRTLKQLYSEADISRIENPEIIQKWLIETDKLQDQLQKKLKMVFKY